ncbi:hypothetical protein RDABS01_035119, partial [Bienertia sinuspersici]
VMSLCWKEGSSDTGRKGMNEIARKYKDGKRVGFAKLSSDVDLYICPHSDAIITILAKHGFFKGMTAIKDICDPLIGCVVWKKCSSSAPATKAKAATVTVENSRREKSPEFSLSPQAKQDKQSVVAPNNNAATVSDTSNQPSKPVIPISIVASKQSADLSDNDDDDDLPEYDFTAAVSQASVSKFSAELKSESSTVSAPITDSQHLGIVPENVKQYPEAHKPSFPTQEQKQTEHLQGLDEQNLIQQSEAKIPSLPIQEQKPMEKPRNLFDDDDMPEWCPPDSMKVKKEETKRTEVSFSASNPSKAPGSGSTDLGSGYLPPPPPPPLPPPPPPPPLTQIQFKERDYCSTPHIPPPPVSINSALNNFMHHRPAVPSNQMQFGDKNSAAISSQMHMKARDYPSAPHLPLPPPPPPSPVGNKAPNNFMHHNPAAVSSQLQFKEREYSFSPHAPPPPPVGNPAANNFMNHGPAAMSSQKRLKQIDYSCGGHLPPPHVDNPAAANNFMHQSPTGRPNQMQFGDNSYSPAPRPLTPFANKPTSNGAIHQSPAIPPGFAPNPALRPCFDQPGIKNPIRPSTQSTRP